MSRLISLKWMLLGEEVFFEKRSRTKADDYNNEEVTRVGLL